SASPQFKLLAGARNRPHWCRLRSETRQDFRLSKMIIHARRHDVDSILQVVDSHPPGSIPVVLITAAASGDAKNLMNSFAAACSLVSDPMPAVNTVVSCKPGGRGPTSSTPFTGTISLIC